MPQNMASQQSFRLLIAFSPKTANNMVYIEIPSRSAVVGGIVCTYMNRFGPALHLREYQD